METAIQTDKLPIFNGSRPYVEIATKGDARLGMYVSPPLVGPKGDTAIFIAFASYHTEKSEINHFTVRGSSTYSTAEGEYVSGLRLNKVIIPVFDKPISSLHFGALADKNGVFEEIGKWLFAQISAEGFIPLVFSPAEYLRSLFVSVEPDPDTKTIISLPDFEAEESVDIAESTSPEQEEDNLNEDEDGDEDGEDEDEDGSDDE